MQQRNEMEEESWLTGRDAQYLNWQEMQNGSSFSVAWPVEKPKGANKNIMQVYIYVTAFQ